MKYTLLHKVCDEKKKAAIVGKHGLLAQNKSAGKNVRSTV